MYGDKVLELNGYTLVLELIEDSEGFNKQCYSIHLPEGGQHDIPGYTYYDVDYGSEMHINDYFLRYVSDHCAGDNYMAFMRDMFRENCVERESFNEPELTFSQYVFQNLDFIYERYLVKKSEKGLP